MVGIYKRASSHYGCAMQRTTESKRKATFPGLNGGGFPILSRWLTFLADAGEIPARSGAVDVAFSCSRSTARISEYRRRRNRNKHTAKIYRRVSNFHGVENLRFSEAISVRIAYRNREVTRVRHCNDRNASTDARNLDEQFASLRVLTDQAKLSLLSSVGLEQLQLTYCALWSKGLVRLTDWDHGMSVSCTAVSTGIGWLHNAFAEVSMAHANQLSLPGLQIAVDREWYKAVVTTIIRRSTPIRLQYNNATTIRRPTLRLHAYLCVGCCTAA